MDWLFDFKWRHLNPLLANLEHTAEDYLAYAGTRDYLRAMMSSDLPRLLVGDAHYLARIYSRDRATEMERQALERLKNQEEKRVAKEKQERETRMSTFAKGLSLTN